MQAKTCLPFFLSQNRKRKKDFFYCIYFFARCPLFFFSGKHCVVHRNIMCTQIVLHKIQQKKRLSITPYGSFLCLVVCIFQNIFMSFFL